MTAQQLCQLRPSQGWKGTAQIWVTAQILATPSCETPRSQPPWQATPTLRPLVEGPPCYAGAAPAGCHVCKRHTTTSELHPLLHLGLVFLPGLSPFVLPLRRRQLLLDLRYLALHLQANHLVVCVSSQHLLQLAKLALNAEDLVLMVHKLLARALWPGALLVTGLAAGGGPLPRGPRDFWVSVSGSGPQVPGNCRPSARQDGSGLGVVHQRHVDEGEDTAGASGLLRFEVLLVPRLLGRPRPLSKLLFTGALPPPPSLFLPLAVALCHPSLVRSEALPGLQQPHLQWQCPALAIPPQPAPVDVSHRCHHLGGDAPCVGLPVCEVGDVSLRAGSRS
mmetsp:Transcript_16536/g.46164  ORF Transcript_16536/g.46164 Transcript_16536/m.46164 type:complete len:335 (-) Transcript_16536:189-1193(-)